ncbi:MAG: tRNA (adenosine(37)-N6)-threonylcarbamoyltransferase complex transferase subunit TsaD [bacterium]
MKILGIETSCDETASSVIELAEDHNAPVTVLSSLVSSQVTLHQQYGGVVPHLAGLAHQQNIDPVVSKALEDAHFSYDDIDIIAVTSGPGLAPALRVGVQYAKEKAKEFKKPLVATNHLEGHIYSVCLHKELNIPSDITISFPALFLVVSGGHTELVMMKDHCQYESVGQTLDDAVGEAYDKVAKMLGLGYPGGPVVDKRALLGNPLAYEFPRPLLASKDYNFSFSGLKTAVLYKLRGQNQGAIRKGQEGEYTDEVVNDICASFQQAAVDVLVRKTVRAVKQYEVKTVGVVGGVSANRMLRESLGNALPAGIHYLIPQLKWTGDNAAMIALAGAHHWIKEKNKQKFWETHQTIDLRSSWPLNDL